MALNGPVILITMWLVMVIIITWIIIETKRYPWLYGGKEK